MVIDRSLALAADGRAFGPDLASGQRGAPVSLRDGVIPYLVTPTTPAGQPDPTALAALAAHAIDAGVHGLAPLGSSGDFPYVADEDRPALIRAVVEVAAKRVPVLPAVGGFRPGQAVAQARAAAEAGADAVLCIVMAFGPMREVEILRFVDAVAQAVDIPVGLYHNPTVGTVPFTDHLVGEAFRSCGVTFVKDASGDLDHIARWTEAAPAGVRVFSSTAVSPTAAILLGAAGWMSGPASAFPAESVRIYDLCRASRWREAAAFERCLNPALDLFKRLGPMRGAKALVAANGLPSGPPIAPLAPLSSEEHALAESCVAEVRRRVAAAESAT